MGRRPTDSRPPPSSSIILLYNGNEDEGDDENDRPKRADGPAHTFFSGTYKK